MRGPLIRLPDGLTASEEPYEPDLRRFYWLNRVLLDPNDPKPKRPVVVVAKSTRGGGAISIVTRSTTDNFGVPHARRPEHGLNKNGWLSRLRYVSSELWTPSNARSMNLLLDDEDFSYVIRDFRL
jgi:hypothetical protein